MRKINIMKNVHNDDNQKQNVRDKMVTSRSKLLKVLRIKTKRKDNTPKNSLDSLVFPMKMLETSLQYGISGNKEKYLSV